MAFPPRRHAPAPGLRDDGLGEPVALRPQASGRRHDVGPRLQEIAEAADQPTAQLARGSSRAGEIERHDKVVYSADQVCADGDFSSGLEITQNTGNGLANLTLTGPGNGNLSLTLKMNNLPASTPAACAVVCVVDGILDLFDYAKFKPCGTTTAGGRLTFTGTVPFNEAPPFEGGCLLPVPALWIRPEEGPAVVCTSGFGTFVPFIPCMGSEC